MDDIARFPLAVDTRAPGGTTNAYVIGRDEAVLVDPAARSPDLDGVVDRHGVTDLVVTHTHADHVGALSYYANRTDGRVWAHADHVDRFVGATGVEPDRRFDDGTLITAGKRDLRVIETPGHTPDHVAFAVGATILVGDLAVAEGSVAIVAGAGDLCSYLESLRRVREANADRLLPGHGERIRDPDATIARLIDHRLEREARIRRAIETGARDLDAITDGAYEKDVSAVRDLATGTVVAHLEKLAGEGVIRWDGKRAEPI